MLLEGEFCGLARGPWRKEGGGATGGRECAMLSMRNIRGISTPHLCDMTRIMELKCRLLSGEIVTNLKGEAGR